MSAKKFEKLIDLIINEDQERANQLFHEIVVEKSREIYESIINEDAIDGLEDEVSADDEGAMDGGDEDFGDEEGGEFDDEDFGDEEGEEEFGDEEDGEFGDEEGELEDRVVDLEDKLDELMAEFEAQMGGDDEEGDMGMDDEEGDMDMDMDDEGSEEDFGGEGDDEESGLMEAAQLKQIGGKTYDKFGKMGNDGEQTKSAGLQNPKRIGDGGAPVQFSGKSETVPKTAKKSNAKEENFGNVNVPGGNAGKTAFKKKFAVPKAETVKAKDTLPESRTTTKRRI
jgi:hypothetical protein